MLDIEKHNPQIINRVWRYPLASTYFPLLADYDTRNTSHDNCGSTASVFGLGAAIFDSGVYDTVYGAFGMDVKRLGLIWRGAGRSN